MKLTKRLAAIAMATTMVFSTSALTLTASAAKWVKTTDGVKYQYDNGTYASNKWLKTKSGDKYYITDDGVRATGWTEIDGEMYYFNKSTGKLVYNKKVRIGSYCYKFDKNGVWNGIVYSKDGKKNVTKSVDVEKLTGQTTSTVTTSTTKTATTSTTNSELGVVKTVTGTIPATIKLNGYTYNTAATNEYIGTTADAVNPTGSNKGNQRYERGNRWAIDITGCSDKDLEVLKYFTNIKVLTLVDFDGTSTMTNLDFCYYMPNLEYIIVHGAINLNDVSGLSACKSLKHFEVVYSKLDNLDGLEKLTKIKVADISFTHLDNVNGLVNCKNLETVYVTHARLTDISALKDKDKLKDLDLNWNRRLKDISVLSTCDSLEIIGMRACTSVNTWETLMKIPNLKAVELFYNVIGSKGPYSVAAKLTAKGVNAVYINDKTMNMGTHPTTKEGKTNALWDAKYRPSVVFGDDRECKANCTVCELTPVAQYKCLF